MARWSVPGCTELRSLGSGGFGEVELARHDATGVLVAIKYLRPDLLADREFGEMFRSEAALLAYMDDPNVVRLYEYVESPLGAAIVMELVDGVSLRRILAEQGATTAEAALVVLKGSLLGLAAAHRRGVVHRDYKPENVLINGDGASKLTDFGLAARAGDRPTPAGTLAYVAPEQIDGAPASPAGDVYAATATFYECLTGAPPFTGESGELLRQHHSAPVPLDPVPAPLRPLVTAGMAKDPRDRPADAAVFATQLAETVAGIYGPGWENRGRRHLGEAALLLAALWPSAAPPAVQGTAMHQIPLHRQDRLHQDHIHHVHDVHRQHHLRRLLRISPAKAAIAAAVITVAAAGTALASSRPQPPQTPNHPAAALHPITLQPSPSTSPSPSTPPSPSTSAPPSPPPSDATALVPVAYEPRFSNGVRAITSKIRPIQYQISLSPAGGPGTFMTSLTWSRWDPAEAVGSGHFQSGSATGSIVLSRSVKAADGTPYYSGLTLSDGVSTRYEWSWPAKEWIKQSPTPPQPLPAFYYATAILPENLYVKPVHPDRLGIDNHDWIAIQSLDAWAADSMTMTGVLNYDKCQPDCASGPMVTFPVQVVATAPQTCTLQKDQTGSLSPEKAYVYSKINVRALSGSAPPSLIGDSVFNACSTYVPKHP